MLRIENMVKVYPGTVALDDVTVEFSDGRVHALLGKNGAGKSTLVKIIAGTLPPTSGQLYIDGHETRMESANDAFAKGIATVYQEMSLVPDLSVAENILLGRMPRKLGGMMIDWPAAYRTARELVDELGVAVEVGKKVSELGVAQRQMVEIVKAMSFRPSVLMLDEPTSALARHETEMLFTLVRRLAARGVSIIYITHRLQELKRIADDVTVLRDGKLIGVVDMAEATPELIVRMMFGAVEQRRRPADLMAGGATALEVRGLGLAGKFRDVDFVLREGEVLGIAGLLGSGRTELLRAIFGAEPWDEGEVFLHGRRLGRGDPADMMRQGLAMTTEDRKNSGLILGMSVFNNLALASMRRHSRRGVIDRGRERETVRRLVERLEIKVPDVMAAVASLSGGNQQKVVVGKWMATEPAVFLFDEPTRGIDVMAKQQIFQTMWDLSRAGLACLFVSSELEELVEVCHRILIMKNGRIVESVEADRLDSEELYVRCMS